MYDRTCALIGVCIAIVVERIPSGGVGSDGRRFGIQEKRRDGANLTHSRCQGCSHSATGKNLEDLLSTTNPNDRKVMSVSFGTRDQYAMSTHGWVAGTNSVVAKGITSQ